MSRPLRCSLIIAAPLGSVRRALWRPDVWIRTLRALGFQRHPGSGSIPELLTAGQHLTFTADSRHRTPRSAALLVHDGLAELPALTVWIGGATRAELRLTTAETGAGVLTTVDFRVLSAAAVAPLVRRRLLELGQMLLGIVTVTAQDPQVVVAGAVLHGGRVLAARRARPPALAGKWEMPGGKVEPGEGEREALARELHEELGITVEVGDPVGPRVDLGDGMELAPYWATLVSGTPIPTEADPAHDLISWVSPADMPALEWLPGDEPFVSAVQTLLGHSRSAE